MHELPIAVLRDAEMQFRRLAEEKEAEEHAGDNAEEMRAAGRREAEKLRAKAEALAWTRGVLEEVRDEIRAGIRANKRRSDCATQ